MTRVRGRAFLVAALLATSAAAQECPDPERGEETAAELIREGYEHWRRDDFRNALEKYRRSHACKASADATLNIANALKALERHAEAVATWKEYLQDPESDPGKHQQILALIAETEPDLAYIEVTVSENGAVVYVDDRRVGTSPLAEPVAVDPGSRQIRVDRGASRGRSQQVDVGKQEKRRVHFVLEEGGASPTPAPTTAPTEKPRPAAAARRPVPTPRPRSAPATPRPDRGASWWQGGAIASGTLALAAAATGTYYGLLASSKWSDARERCPRGLCERPSDLVLDDEAGRAADVATGAFIVAGVSGALTATFLWISFD